MTLIKSFDGDEFDGYLALPASGYGPGIVVLQEIFGVNEYVRGVADWYAAHGFVALAPDLFWRLERGVQLTGGDWDKAIDFYQRIDEDKAVADSAAALSFFATASGVQRSCWRGRILHGRQTCLSLGDEVQAGLRGGLLRRQHREESCRSKQSK